MSLLAGVTTERSDKFNDMYYQKPSWFARKYVYHDTKVRCPDVRMPAGMIMINASHHVYCQGIWYSCPDLIIHAKTTTR